MPHAVIQSSPGPVRPQRPHLTSPAWRLRIYTASTAYTGHGSPDPTDNLVAWNITKSRDNTQSVGQATFQLTARSLGGKVAWKDLPLMSVVEFQVASPYPVEGSPWRTRFLGYVIGVQDQWNTTATSAQRFVTLSCVDLMYAFSTQVYYPSSWLVSAPAPPTAQHSIEAVLKRLMTAQSQAITLQNTGGNTTGVSYLGSLLEQFAKSPINTSFFIPPGTALWALIQWLMPIFFNPSSVLNTGQTGGYAGWQEWITAWIVPSFNYAYSSTYAMTQGSWW